MDAAIWVVKPGAAASFRYFVAAPGELLLNSHDRWIGNGFFLPPSNRWVSEYLENCNTYHIKIDPGVVSCLQTEGQDLYISCDGLLAVASILCNPKNPCVTRLHVQARYETRSNQYVCLILEQILHANRTLLRAMKKFSRSGLGLPCLVVEVHK